MYPEFGFKKEIKKDGYTFLTIDTQKAKWQKIPYRTLGDWGKRKFENGLILFRPKERLKISYVSPDSRP